MTPPAPFTQSKATLKLRSFRAGTSRNGEGEDPLHVPIHRPGIRPQGPDLIPPGPGRLFRLQELLELAHAFGIQEHPFRRGELQGIPLCRIVAGGDTNPPGGPFLFHREKKRGRRDHAQVHDVTAHRLEAGGSTSDQHGTRGPGIPSQEHGSATLGLPQKRTERCGERGDQLRSEREADFSSESGDAHHEFRREDDGHVSCIDLGNKGCCTFARKASGLGGRGSMKPVSLGRRRMIH